MFYAKGLFYTNEYIFLCQHFTETVAQSRTGVRKITREHTIPRDKCFNYYRMVYSHNDVD